MRYLLSLKEHLDQQRLSGYRIEIPDKIIDNDTST